MTWFNRQFCTRRGTCLNISKCLPGNIITDLYHLLATLPLLKAVIISRLRQILTEGKSVVLWATQGSKEDGPSLDMKLFIVVIPGKGCPYV